MQMARSDDRSELERELELYLGRELEAGVSLTVRVQNTQKVDTTVTFRDDGGGAVTITIDPGQVIALTGVRRSKDSTAVAGSVKNLPTDGDPYTGLLRMEVQDTQFVVAPAKDVWMVGVQPVPGFARRYTY